MLETVLASSDFAVGRNRLVFALIDSLSGPLKGEEPQVLTFFLAGPGQEGPIESVKAVFRSWPVGPGGVFTASVNFDRAGTWGIGVVIADSEGVRRQSSTRIEVKEQSDTPDVGEPAPLSVSKTARDVETMEELTTDANPDPALYEMTIAEAVGASKPLLVVFSTPGFCQTATCGPQLEVVKELRSEYDDRMNFIHIEVYDNPAEIEGDLSNAILSPTLTEWNLPSEPWTFIVGDDGRIFAKFEAFSTREELEEAIAGVVEENGTG